jgi:ABC-2 type transport system permease protein
LIYTYFGGIGMVKYIKLYLAFVSQNIKSIMEYKVDFAVGILSTFLVQVSSFLFIWVIFQNVSEIKGWSFYEITLVYGLLTTTKSLFGVFMGPLWDFGYFIRQGHFDRVLLRPINPLFHLLSSRIHHHNLGEVAVGLALTVMSIFRLGLEFSFLDLLMLILFIISGTVIISAIMIITATSSFWLVHSKAIAWAVFETSSFALYPTKVFNKFIGVVFTWIIPFTFASYYPANYFLNKEYYYYSFLSPFIAVVLWFAAMKVWNIGLKNYTSTGS